MRPHFLSITFVFATLLLLSGSVQAAHFCIEPGFGQGASNAELIFSGTITKIERVQTGAAAIGEYVVTFKVQRWWKGTPANDTRVFWRSSFMDCPSLPVGEVGDNYLVYADPSRSTLHEYQTMPEVTIFNRTAKLPGSRKAEMIVEEGFRQPARISTKLPVNRADGSNDVEILFVLQECGCLPAPPPGTAIESESQEKERPTACTSCMGRRLKQF